MERCPCCEEPWTREEDDRLFAHIQSRGEGSWTSIPDAAGLKRCGKNCQIRWINSLLPDLNRWNICDDEEQLIVKLHALLGNRWSLIAGRLPGRTGNEIKNYWNIHISRKLLSQGIDPNSHRPFHYVDNESSTSNSHSLHHGNDQTVDYTVNFELGEASRAGNRNEEPPYVNLDLSISLPCYSRETVDAKEGTDEMKFPSVG